MNPNIAICYFGNSANYLDHASAIKDILNPSHLCIDIVVQPSIKSVFTLRHKVIFLCGPSFWDLVVIALYRAFSFFQGPSSPSCVIIYTHEPWPFKWLNNSSGLFERLKILLIFAYQAIVFSFVDSICSPSLTSQTELLRFTLFRNKVFTQTLPLPFNVDLNSSSFRADGRSEAISIFYNQGKRAESKGLALALAIARHLVDYTFVISIPGLNLQASFLELIKDCPNVMMMNYPKSISEIEDLALASDVALVLGEQITQSAAACLAWSTGGIVATNLDLDLPTTESLIIKLDFPPQICALPLVELLENPAYVRQAAQIAAQLLALKGFICSSRNARHGAAKSYRKVLTDSLHSLMFRFYP